MSSMTDRHLVDGLDQIRFQHLPSKEVKNFESWQQGQLALQTMRKLPAPHYEIPDDDRFNSSGTDLNHSMKLFRLGIFIYNQFKSLRDSINQTCQVFYESKGVPAEFQLQKLMTINEAMKVYYQYENEKFFMNLDGEGYNIATRPFQLEQNWLIAQIFGNEDTISENLQLDQSRIKKCVQMIQNLECLKLGHILWDYDEDAFPLRMDDKLIAKLEYLTDDDETQTQSSTLKAFCFYLAFAYNGMVSINFDMYATRQNATQAWRLNPEVEFSIQFVQIISLRNIPCDSTVEKKDREREAKLVTGLILPHRVPSTKLDCLELSKLNKSQYILLTDLLTDIRKNEFSKRPSKLNEYGSEIERYFFYVCSWDMLQEALDLTNLIENKQGTFKAFRKENCKRDTPSQYLKENVMISREQIGKHEYTFKANLKVFDDIHFIENDKKKFVFNATKRVWQLEGSQDVKDTLIQIRKNDRHEQVQWKIDTKLIQQLSTEKNADKLLSILEQIPTLDIKLSYLQQAVVSSSENLLCLGRSGTGKTTSSVLRLFSQEIMYMSLKKFQQAQEEMQMRKRIAQHNKKELISDAIEEEKKDVIKVTLTSSDFLKPTYMRTVFISASPVLVNEVNRYYATLRESLINFLKTKEEAAAKQNNDEQNNQNASEEQQVRNQQDELLKLIQIEADEIEREIASEQQLNLPSAFEDLKAKHFPLFLTVKQLLHMLDASLYESFFYRDSQNKVVGMDNNLTWHNENKGLFMINQQFKTDQNYDQLLLDFTNEVMNDVEADDLKQEIQPEETKNVQNTNCRGGWSQWQYKRQTGVSNKYWQQQLSFEVDYDIFATRFFARFKQKSRSLQRQKKLSESMIWTEIFSVIKGSIESANFYSGFIPAAEYINKYGSPTLTRHELQTVYWIFIEYEKWKAEQGAFDLMDLVMHIRKSNKVQSNYYQELRMDYLMIDEVQDLTPLTLDLFIRLTKNKVFFAGDTAQTIAKGVGARFSDLQQLFKTLEINVIQLTTNYRSHGKILALANSVVSILETLFPFSIDKLQKETSESDGLRPILLQALKPHELKRFFLGSKTSHDVQQHHAFASSKPQFGCNQVIIVRDQEMKDKVPEFLANMLCLTVYEAKGLEFDDVFLYNFFSGENIEASHWKLLNDIGFYEAVTENPDQEAVFTKIDDFCKQATQEELQSERQQHPTKTKMNKNVEKKERKMISQSTKNRSLIYRKYSLLCIELKYLYVAITRPRRRLIIYDDEIKIRQPIQRVWEALGIVDIVNQNMIDNGKLPEDVQKLFNQGYVAEQLSSQSEWKLQGIKFFKKKCFDQAIKCFAFAGEQPLVNRCMAYQLADLASSKTSEIESNLWRVRNSSTLSKIEKRALLKLNRSIRVMAKRDFNEAGANFEQCELLVQAASCYFSARSFERAAMVFEKLKQFSQAGECYMHLQNLEFKLKAAEMFEKGKLITRAIECYEQLGAWEQLLHCLHKNGTCFREDERQRLANKYIPIALNKLYLLLSDDQSTINSLEKNKGAIQELKIKRKFEKDDKIEEEDSQDEEFSSSEEEPFEGSENNSDQNEQTSVDQSKLENSQAKDEVQINVQLNFGQQMAGPQPMNNEKEEDSVARLSDISYEVVDEGLEEEKLEIFDEVFQLNKKKSSFQQQKQDLVKAKSEEQKPHQDIDAVQTDQTEAAAEETKDGQEDSFEVIEEKSNLSYDKLSLKQEEKPAQDADFEELAISVADFDHLSQYDPDDEFLQNAHSISILESILSSKLNQSSDFSVISGDDQNDLSILSLNSSVKGSENIRFIAKHQKIEDKIVQKIIYYISLFSSEVKEKLESLHISQKPKKIIDLKFEEDAEIKLDQIPLEFIELVLSILEHYDLIRLSLIICNKFKLNQHLGKYVVQSCIKYSNLHLHRYNYFQANVLQVSQLKQRQASVIAHEVMHNVLGLISPKYLTLKKFNEPMTVENSLGLQNYRLMLQLGFWKKLVYITNGRTALSLCFKFNDLDNFNLIEQKMFELDASETHITTAQHQQLKQAKHLLLFKISMQVIQIEGKFTDQCKPMFVEDYKTIEDKFAKIEMRLQDILFSMNNGQRSLQLVNDILVICKYMVILQNDEPERKNKVVINDKKIQEMQLIEEQSIKKRNDEARSNAENVITGRLLIEATNDEEYLLQSCLAFYLLSFYNLQRQLEKIIPSTEKNQKLIENLLFKLRQIDINFNLQEDIQRKLSSREIIAKKAFFACFNLHALNEEDFELQEAESLFGVFKKSHYLMSSHSILAQKLQDIQQKLQASTISQQITKLFLHNCKKYFYQSTLKDKILKKVQLLETDPFAVDGPFTNQFKNDSQLAFMIDLDLQFVMVPCKWANTLIEQRLTRVHDILHRVSAKNLMEQLKNKQTDRDILRFEAHRFNLVAEQIRARNVRNDWDQSMGNMISDLIRQDSKHQINTDEFILLKEEKAYKKVRNIIQVQQPSRKTMIKNLVATSKPFHLTLPSVLNNYYTQLFSISFFNVNEIKTVEKALKNDKIILKMAFALVDLAMSQFLIDDVEYFSGQVLEFLNAAHTAFSLIQQEHIFIDYLRCKLKQLSKQKSLNNDQQIVSSILKAVIKVAQVSILTKEGAISMASSKLMVFYKQINSQVQIKYATQILEKAFYPVLVGMLGSAYVPEKVHQIFDLHIDLEALKHEAHLHDPDAGEYYPDYENNRHYNQEDKEFLYRNEVYTEWERQEITDIKAHLAERTHKVNEDSEILKPLLLIKPKDLVLEAVKSDQADLVEMLRHAVELLKRLNQDDFHEWTCKALFNILMAATVNLKITKNDQKKQVSAYLIKKGFQQLADCPISDYFQNISFQYFDNDNEEDIVGLRQMFADTEDNQKFAFFAHQNYLLQIDVTACQSLSKQKNNQNIFESMVKTANHQLRQLVKRDIAKRILRRQIRRLKNTRLLNAGTLRTIATLRSHQIVINLQGIDQSVFAVSGIENDLSLICNYLSSVNERITSLRSLVLAKSGYLSSSFDITMLYACDKKLAAIQHNLLITAQYIVENKLYPLRGYQNLELSQAHNQVKTNQLQATFDAELKHLSVMLAVWKIKSRAQKSQKEVEHQDSKTKRLNMKWSNWNQLARRKARLQNKLKSLQQ